MPADLTPREALEEIRKLDWFPDEMLEPLLAILSRVQPETGAPQESVEDLASFMADEYDRARKVRRNHLGGESWDFRAYSLEVARAILARFGRETK